MINFRFITHLMGRLLLIETGFLLICLCVALFYQEPDWTAFAYTAGITLLASLAITTFVKPRDRILAKKDGYFTVTLVWIIFSLFGSLPYILGGTLPRFTDAFFETISGFTTTGASVITNVEIVPHATLFWRSLTHWLGGLGIIMLFLAILPSLGIEGRDLYVAETTGPVHSKTSFTFTGTARKLWVIYVALTALLTVLLCLGKMGLFDSICHAMSTMGSGGFSTKNTSVGYWDSPYIHYILILFMFIAGTNFGLVYAAIKGQWRKLFQDNEFRLYTAIALGASLIIATVLYIDGWGDIEKSFRDALFQVVTIMSTTGFATADYLLWPPFLGMIIFLLIIIGASAGSTAGGLKIVRLQLLFKNSFAELKRIIHPNAIITTKYNGKSVHPDIMTGIMGFAILYLILFLIGSLLMTFLTEDITTACSSVATCLSNVGPGFGSIGPMYNFAHLNEAAKAFLSLLMLIGRLEIFTVMVLFTKSFWKK